MGSERKTSLPLHIPCIIGFELIPLSGREKHDSLTHSLAPEILSKHVAYIHVHIGRQSHHRHMYTYTQCMHFRPSSIKTPTCMYYCACMRGRSLKVFDTSIIAARVIV